MINEDKLASPMQLNNIFTLLYYVVGGANEAHATQNYLIEFILPIVRPKMAFPTFKEV